MFRRFFQRNFSLPKGASKIIRNSTSGGLPHVVNLGYGNNLRHGVTICRLTDGLPLVVICAAWRADSVLYGSCILGIYNDDAVYLRQILALGGEVRLKNSTYTCSTVDH